MFTLPYEEGLFFSSSLALVVKKQKQKLWHLLANKFLSYMKVLCKIQCKQTFWLLQRTLGNVFSS